MNLLAEVAVVLGEVIEQFAHAGRRGKEAQAKCAILVPEDAKPTVLSSRKIDETEVNGGKG